MSFVVQRVRVFICTSALVDGIWQNDWFVLVSSHSLWVVISPGQCYGFVSYVLVAWCCIELSSVPAGFLSDFITRIEQLHVHVRDPQDFKH